MTRIHRKPREILVMGLLFCSTLLLHMVLGFIPSKTVVVDYDRLPKLAHTKSRESSMARIRQRETIIRKMKSSEHSKIQTVAATTTIASASSLNPIEAWCATHMNVWYDKSLSVKCPFFRRRMTDFLDGVDMVMRFLIIRHKSLPLIGPPPGCRSAIATDTKHTHLDRNVLMETIRRDWTPDNRHKGYYITGRLNTTIYRDDCWFDGPDPDMPVRGLRKYLNAASQLFDTSKSTAELLSLEIGDPSEAAFWGSKTKFTIVAQWKLKGVLHLPWHPSLPVWTGRTIYHFDDEHMIYRHEEHWDISVAQAFTQTLWPELGNVLWKTTRAEDQEGL